MHPLVVFPFCGHETDNKSASCSCIDQLTKQPSLCFGCSGDIGLEDHKSLEHQLEPELSSGDQAVRVLSGDQQSADHFTISHEVKCRVLIVFWCIYPPVSLHVCFLSEVASPDWLLIRLYSPPGYLCNPSLISFLGLETEISAENRNNCDEGRMFDMSTQHQIQNYTELWVDI